jgi:hypothetical protein
MKIKLQIVEVQDINDEVIFGIVGKHKLKMLKIHIDLMIQIKQQIHNMHLHKQIKYII